MCKINNGMFAYWSALCERNHEDPIGLTAEAFDVERIEVELVVGNDLAHDTE